MPPRSRSESCATLSGVPRQSIPRQNISATCGFPQRARAWVNKRINRCEWLGMMGCGLQPLFQLMVRSRARASLARFSASAISSLRASGDSLRALVINV